MRRHLLRGLLALEPDWGSPRDDPEEELAEPWALDEARVLPIDADNRYPDGREAPPWR